MSGGGGGGGGDSGECVAFLSMRPLTQVVKTNVIYMQSVILHALSALALCLNGSCFPVSSSFPQIPPPILL